MLDSTNGPSAPVCHLPALARIRSIQEKCWNYTVIKWKLPPGGLTLVSKSQTVTLASIKGKANRLLLTVGSELMY